MQIRPEELSVEDAYNNLAMMCLLIRCYELSVDPYCDYWIWCDYSPHVHAFTIYYDFKNPEKERSLTILAIVWAVNLENIKKANELLDNLIKEA